MSIDAVVLDPERDGKADVRGSVDDKSLRTIIQMLGRDAIPSENFMGGLATFPPGARVECHLHPDAEEVNVVLAGEGSFLTDKGAERVRVGDWQFIPKGVRHGHENTGEVPLTILWLYSPPSSTMPK